MSGLLGLLIFVICLSLSSAAVCEDVDTKACELMAQNHQNMCNDTCMSSRCQRFCGHCLTVKCYECHEIDNPANCTNLVTCPTKDHYCYTTQTFADDFSEVYKMGCAMKDLCNQYLGPENRKKNIDVNGACCPEDKCNNKQPLIIITEQRPTKILTGTPVNLTADPNACINRDDTACNRFQTAKRDVCSDPCFATNYCPRMCGQCFNCYSCNDMYHVNDCNVTNVCHAGYHPWGCDDSAADEA